MLTTQTVSHRAIDRRTWTQDCRQEPGNPPGLCVFFHHRDAESIGVVPATVDGVVALGFEVRVELTSAATGDPFTAQITFGDAEALALREGDTVYVRATRVPPIADQDQTTLTSA